MGILENAAEIDRLHGLQDMAEKHQFEAAARKREAEAAVERYEQQRQEAGERIDALYDGIAGCIPSNTSECLGLAVLLRSMTADSVFFQDSTEARDRADKIVDNLVVGLKRLSPLTPLPDWFSEHIRDAETGTPAGFDDTDLPVANENGGSLRQH